MTQNIITGREEDKIRELTTGFLVDDSRGKLVTTYDFAKMGGAVSTIHLPGRIPAGAKVTMAYADVLSALTSSGSTAEVAVNVGSAALQAAAAVSGAPWSTVGLKDLSADPVPGTESGYLEPTNTSAFGVSIVITVEALTAGKVMFVVHYDVTEV